MEHRENFQEKNWKKYWDTFRRNVNRNRRALKKVLGGTQKETIEETPGHIPGGSLPSEFLPDFFTRFLPDCSLTFPEHLRDYRTGFHLEFIPECYSKSLMRRTMAAKFLPGFFLDISRVICRSSFRIFSSRAFPRASWDFSEFFSQSSLCDIFVVSPEACPDFFSYSSSSDFF